MREIKFRQAQFNMDGSFREWHYWGFIEQYGHITFVGPETHSLAPQGAWENSYQYTGRKDKNDRELWENDLITNTSRNQGKPHPIEFWEGKFIARYGDLRYDIANELAEIEKVGNIYENPELLE